MCGVDRLYLLIPRLPDDIIRHIRDELLELIEIPIPQPPEPIPLSFCFDVAIRDLSVRNVAKMQAAAIALQAGAKVMLNAQPLIWYLCVGDHPDLYFWVEYSIGGAWTTMYHPPVRCNTYWDYACGSEVTIRVCRGAVTLIRYWASKSL